MRRLNALVAGALLLPTAAALAADHGEAPLAQADPAADITDLYAWHTDDGALVAIIGFAGLGSAGGTGTFDADVLYGFHIDTDLDNAPDIDVWARFGENNDGAWGLQVLDMPGADGPVEGAVGTVLTSGDAKAYAGLRDDPFFFDLTGYLDTLGTGTISFDSGRDAFAGTNVTAIVLEMDASGLGNGPIQVWATTGRK